MAKNAKILQFPKGDMAENGNDERRASSGTNNSSPRTKRRGSDSKKVAPSSKKTNSNSRNASSSSLKSDRQRKRKANKADNLYNSMYAGADKKSTPSNAEPRAAVYTGKMGAKQKQSSRMQAKKNPIIVDGAIGFASFFTTIVASRFARNLCLVLIVLVFVFSTLHKPAAEYYESVQINERAKIEYADLKSRNAHQKSNLEFYETEAGMEQIARQDLGMIKEGEKIGRVSGVSKEESDPVEGGAVRAESIEATEHWFSPLLNFLFGEN